MSMSPGRSVTSPRSISVAPVGSSVGFDRDDAVALDHDHGRRPHLAGVDVDPAVRREGSIDVAHGTGSTTQVELWPRRCRGRAAGASTRPGTTP